VEDRLGAFLNAKAEVYATIEPEVIQSRSLDIITTSVAKLNRE
jgi:hypothetical protein